MNSGNFLQLDLSLKTIAEATIAVIFWEREDVKKKLDIVGVDELTNIYSYKSIFEPVNVDVNKKVSSSQDIINYIFGQLNLLHLPGKLVEGIKISIVRTGQKLFYWREYVTCTLEFDIKYARTIYWTPYGDIDELKIVRDFWLKDSVFPGDACCYNDCNMKNKLFCVAVSYCQESFVRKQFKRMKKEILQYIGDDKNLKWTPYTVIATWSWFCRNGPDKPDLEDSNFKIPPGELRAKYLFLHGRDSGCHFSAKYFYNQLTESQKHKAVLTRAKQACEDLKEIGNGWHWGTEIHIKLLLFCINEMTEIQRLEFISKRFFLIWKFLVLVWPYQEFCEKILVGLIPQVSNEHLKSLLALSLDCLIPEGKYRSMYFTNQIFYRHIFGILLSNVPEPVSKNFCIEDDFKNIKKLLKCYDYSSLSLIVSKINLRDRKNELMRIGLNFFKRSILTGHYANLNKFIGNLKLSKEELKSFKESCDELLNTFLVFGNFKSADRFLNWRYDTDDEKNEVKSQISAVQYYCKFIQSNDFETANNFLNWRFDTEEERTAVKNSLKSDEFLLNQIFEIWSSWHKTPDLASEKCCELLKWFFQSEEEVVQFRKKIIEDEFFVEKYWDGCASKRTFSNLNHFFTFCLLTSDEIEVLKIDMAYEVNWYIDTFLLKKNKFDMVDALLDWIYKNEEHKNNCIKNYMNSHHGCLLCLKIFRNFEKSPEDLLTFFNTWIKSSVDYSELYFSLNKCAEFSDDVNSLKRVKHLLCRRKRGQVGKSDLDREIPDGESYPSGNSRFQEPGDPDDAENSDESDNAECSDPLPARIADMYLKPSYYDSTDETDETVSCLKHLYETYPNDSDEDGDVEYHSDEE